MAGAKPLVGVLAAGSAALLLVSGCGGKKSAATGPTTTAVAPATTTTAAPPLGRAAYDAKMRAVGRSVTNAIDALGTPTTKAAVAKAVSGLQTRLRAAADRLAAISAPARVKAQHAALVKAVRDFADELDAVIANVRTGKLPAPSVPATLVSLPGVGEIQQASTAIANKGYAIGGG
jgi:hypothetical protein